MKQKNAKIRPAARNCHQMCPTMVGYPLCPASQRDPRGLLLRIIYARRLNEEELPTDICGLLAIFSAMPLSVRDEDECCSHTGIEAELSERLKYAENRSMLQFGEGFQTYGSICRKQPQI